MARKTNKMDMTVTEQLEHIKEDICDHYCKHMEKVQGTHKHPKYDFDYLQVTYCSTCPLNEL